MAKDKNSLFERHTPEVVDSCIKQVMELRSRGASEPIIIQEVFTDWSDEDADLVWEMALARILDLKEPRIMLPLFMTRDDLRFATHRFIAEHRAKRLACGTIIDVGCGIGSQTISFAKTCKKVIAIDCDPRKVAFAKANCQKMGITNVEFLVGDAIERLPSIKSIPSIGPVDIVFCDPDRPSQEKKRSASSFQPSIVELVEVLGHTTNDVAIELPPRMKDIPLNGELEYASVHGILARLTLYRGGLATSDKSAVVLPIGTSLSNTSPSFPHPFWESPIKESPNLPRFLFEIDQAIHEAGLIDHIPGLFSVIKGTKKGTNPILAAGNNQIDTQNARAFFRAQFSTITFASTKEEVCAVLKRYGAGKAIIRYSIDPQGYWAERKKLEEGLTGQKKIHIFEVPGGFFLGDKISEPSPQRWV